MDEKDFELLSVLNKTRNITRAAEQLYITQSALSKRIKAIEKDLGTEILLRSHQGILFTPQGETILAHCARAAEEMSLMRQNLNSMEDEVCGTLNAGISINFAQYRLPDVLADYHKQFPRVRLHITTDQSRQLYRQMLDGALDMAVLRGEYLWEHIQFLLSQENICLIYNEEYEGRPLSDYIYISHRTDSSQEAMLARWLREHGLTPRPNGFCVNSLATCVEMVARGLGWALIPEIALKSFPGRIIPCFFEDGEPFIRRTYLFCQREAARLPQVQAFMDTLKKHRQNL